MDKSAIHRKVEDERDFGFFSVISYSVHNANKGELTYRVLHCPDWVNVLAVTDAGEIILVEQFRYALNLETLELPGGIIDSGQDALASAKQELLEEAGYGDGEWIFLGKYLANAGLQNNYVHSYFCRSPRLLQPPDGDEGTKVQLVPVCEALKSLGDGGRLAQAFPLATFQLALLKGLLML